MRTSRTTGRKAAFAAIGVLAVAGAGGTAYAATGSGPSGPAPTAPTAANGGVGALAARATHSRPRSLLQRADHATVELKVKGQWVTYTLDRGRVTAVSPTSITLARPDGQTVTETINSATRYSGVTSESAVQLQRPAVVVSDGGTALRIHQGQIPAGQAAGNGS